MDGLWPTFTRRRQTPDRITSGSEDLKSDHMPVPERVVLPLQDVYEDSFEVYVNTGDRVKTGQSIGAIGTPPNHVAVHATVSGEVTAIIPMPHPLVQQVHSVRVTSDGADARAGKIPFERSGCEDPWVFFRNMGVPLDYPHLTNASALILNLTEFEPNISSRQRLLLEEEEKCVKGTALLRALSGAGKTVIISEKKEVRLQRSLQALCGSAADTSVHETDAPYPETIQEMVRQRANREDGAQSGTTRYPVVVDLASVVAVYDAYYLGMPFLERLITVSGSAVPEPKNIWVRCGTQLSDIITFCGASVSVPGRITIGGPLMGRPQYSLDAPLLKKGGAVYATAALAFQEERKSRFYKRCTCIRCGKCVDVCPARIAPCSIAELAERHRIDEAVERGLFSCLECGLCYYVCPSMIPLVELIKLGKLNRGGRDSLLIFNTYKNLYS